MPKDSKVLASNEKSQFQSISFNINQSKIWAVQYHPEFNPNWMAGLINQRKKILLDNNVYRNEIELDKEIKILENFKNITNYNYKIYNDVLDSSYHSLELTNWLNYET